MKARRRTAGEIRAGLKALYSEIATQNRDQIDEIVEHVVLVMQADERPIERTRLAFRNCDTATTKKELAAIKKLASGIAEKIGKPRALTGKKRQLLADRLETLHKPTIDALANSRAPLNVGALRVQFPPLLRQSNVSTSLIESLHLIVAACDTAEISDSIDEGPPQHRRDQVISRMLANAFAVLTGKEPTVVVIGKSEAKKVTLVPYAGACNTKRAKEPGKAGPFLAFLDSAFITLGVSSGPTNMAELAIKDRRASQARKTDP